MRLYLDACAIIYAVEGVPHFRQAVLSHIRNVEQSPGSVLLTSRLSRLECRVKPLRERQTQLLAAYDALLAHSALELMELSADVVERATAVCADTKLATPDALHVASALIAKADAFLTADARLAKCGLLPFILL